MSRDAPPPLPVGYRVGEKVFFTGPSQTLGHGDKLVHGGQGEVMGPGTGEDRDKLVIVQFQGNKSANACWLTTVRCLRAASATTPRLRPKRTRGAAHAPRVPATASAAAPHALTA